VQLLLVLAVLWGAVLIPPWVADRRRDRPVQTMASFHRRLWQLEQLEQSSFTSDLDDRVGYDADDTSGGIGGTGVSRTALRRRRQVFFFLLSAVVASLGVLVVLRTMTVVYVHAASLLVFTSYVTLLVRHHQRATEQVSKVRYLSPIRAPRPAVVVLRSGTAR
jgi:hypothetical protein